MKLLNKLVPSFLKKLDHHLLLNHRLIWETRFHYVLFYGLTALLGATALGYIYPMSLSLSLPSQYAIAGIVAVPSGILLLYWVYTQMQYSIEQNFGKRFSGLALARFGIYTATFFLFALPSLQLGRILDNRMASLVSESEWHADLLSLNMGNPYFINDVYDSYNYSSEKSYGNNYGDIYQYIACAETETENSYCSYGFDYFGYDYSQETKQLYKPSIESFFLYGKDNEHIRIISSFKEIFNKYGGDLEASPDEVLALFKAKKQLNLGLENRKEFVKSQMDSIQEAHRELSSTNYSVLSRLSILFALGFSLLLFNFKSVSLKDFILSIISIIGVGLASGISVGLYAGMFGGGNEEVFFAFLSLGIVLFTLFKVKSISTATTYSKFLTICTTSLSFFAPFSILWVCAISDMLNIIKINTSRPDEIFVMNLILAGAFFYLAVVMPWLRKKFLRLQSLPRG
jgi:hypothetical protein